MTLLAGLDVGTTSVKGLLVSHGEPVLKGGHDELTRVLA